MRILLVAAMMATTAHAQMMIGPYMVHSIPGGPSLTKLLPGTFNAEGKTWSEWAFISTADPAQSAVIAGLGDAAKPGFVYHCLLKSSGRQVTRSQSLAKRTFVTARKTGTGIITLATMHPPINYYNPFYKEGRKGKIGEQKQ
jgi:hypothetical protein